MPDFDVNLFTIIFGTIILGLGYVGMSLKHLAFGKDFKKLKVFDKTLQSLILGTISFFVAINLGVMKFPEFTEAEILTAIIENPQMIILQLFFVIALIGYWIAFETFIKNKFDSKKRKKSIRDFKKAFLPPKKQK